MWPASPLLAFVVVAGAPLPVEEPPDPPEVVEADPEPEVDSEPEPPVVLEAIYVIH